MNTVTTSERVTLKVSLVPALAEAIRVMARDDRCRVGAEVEMALEAHLQNVGRWPPWRGGGYLSLYVRPELARVLERYVQQHRPRTTSCCVIEAALEEWFAKQGLWPPSGKEDR